MKRKTYLNIIVLIVCYIQLIPAQEASMERPKYLQKNDTIAILAPAGIIKNEISIYQAKELAENWGLNVVIGQNVFSKNNHFAGTDAQRLNDFQSALDDSSIKAIWCARGGYGTVRIIDQLDFSKFKENPKWIIGYSDITVLHNHVHNLGFETIHGMMPVNMEFSESSRKKSVKTLQKVLFGNKLNYSIPSSKYNKLGNANGIIVGGNLTILENLLGTKSSLDTTEKILFFEEIGEYKYHIDRLIRALDRNNYFNNCNGLIIGGMSHIKKNNPAFGESIEEIILEITSKYDFPIVFNFPAGHDPENRALLLGREINLKVTESITEIKFSK